MRNWNWPPTPGLNPGLEAWARDTLGAETSVLGAEGLSAEDGINVYHLTTQKGAVQGIRNGIDPERFNRNSRFGGAFYVAEQLDTSVAELRHHGNTPVDALQYSLNLSKAKVLDLTDPTVARRHGTTLVVRPVRPRGR